MSLSTQEKKALAGMLGVSMFVGFAIWQIGKRNFWFEAKNTYFTKVTDADGLRIGSAVTISGLRVGEVAGLEVEPDNRITVTLEVQKTVAERIREGSVANVFRAFIIGEKKIDIIPGALDGPEIPHRGTISGKEATDLSEFLSGRKLSEMMNSVDTLLAGITTALKDTNEIFSRYKSGEMNEVIAKVPPVLNNVLKLTDDLIVMTQELKKKNMEIPKFVDSGARVFGRLDKDLFANGLMKNFVVAGTDTFEKIDQDLLETKLMAKAFGNMDKTMQYANVVLAPVAERQKLVISILDALESVSAEMKKNPVFAKTTLETMQELTITLKALQKTWFLEDQTAEVKKQEKAKHKKEMDAKANKQEKEKLSK